MQSFIRRRLLPLLAIATLLVAIATVAWEPPAPFRPGQGIARVASSGLYSKIGETTRPLAVGSPSPAIVNAMPIAPAGQLEFEVAFPAGTAEGVTAQCTTSYRPNGGEAIRKNFAISASQEWIRQQLRVPAAPAGATVELSCLGVREVVWSQPRVVAETATAPAPLIILLSLDTLRADHVSGFGAKQEATPVLAALGDEGIRMLNAASQFTWTLPSHFAMFYSRMFGFPTSVRPVRGLTQTLAEHGFATAGFTGGGFVGSVFRFHYGFDSYIEYDPKSLGISDIDALPRTLEDTQAWLSQHETVPSFAFVHTYAVHEATPEEREIAKRKQQMMPDDPTPELVDKAAAFYDLLVSKLDSRLTGFFDYVREAAERRPVLLVVTSDHGEAFGEHNNFRHGIGGKAVTLDDEVVHVPMIFWSPSAMAEIPDDRTPSTLLDLAPTILAAVGIDGPESMEGRSFWPLLSGHWSWGLRKWDPKWQIPAVSYKAEGWGVPAAWSSRGSKWKLIAPLSHPPAMSLYDLETDPSTSRNLAKMNPARLTASLEELSRTLRRIDVGAPTGTPGLPLCPHCGWNDLSSFWESIDPQAVAPPAAPGEAVLDEETRDRLERLGYLD